MEVRKDFSVSSLHLLFQSENFRFCFFYEKMNSLPVGSKIWEIISTSESCREFIAEPPHARAWSSIPTKNWEQHRTNSQLMAFFEITQGCSLLTLTGYCALSCAGHVTHIWKLLSHFKLACPLSIYPFFKKNYSVEQFACFCF